MSASCHVSKLAKPDSELDVSTDSSLHDSSDSLEALELVERELLTSTEAEDDETVSNTSGENRLERVAQSKVGSR